MKGKGKFISTTGEYNGNFKNGIKMGEATFISQNGDKYIGEYVDNKKNGKGEMFFINGDYYNGEYKNDLRNGKAEYNWKEGSKYIEDFIDDKNEGTRKYIFSNKDKYIGEFSYDNRNGKGKYISHKCGYYVGNGKMILKREKAYMFIEMGKNMKGI